MSTVEELKEIVAGQWYPQSVNDACSKAANEIESLNRQVEELKQQVERLQFHHREKDVELEHRRKGFPIP